MSRVNGAIRTCRLGDPVHRAACVWMLIGRCRQRKGGPGVGLASFRAGRPRAHNRFRESAVPHIGSEAQPKSRISTWQWLERRSHACCSSHLRRLAPGRPPRQVNLFGDRRLAATIFAFTASRLKLAPFCIGGNSIAVLASFSTSCWTNTKRQNSYLNQSKYCCAPSLVPLSGQPRALEGIEAKVGDIRHVRLGLVTDPAARLIDETGICNHRCARRRVRFLRSTRFHAEFDGPLPVIMSIWL